MEEASLVRRETWHLFFSVCTNHDSERRRKREETERAPLVAILFWYPDVSGLLAEIGGGASKGVGLLTHLRCMSLKLDDEFAN